MRKRVPLATQVHEETGRHGKEIKKVGRGAIQIKKVRIIEWKEGEREEVRKTL